LSTVRNAHILEKYFILGYSEPAKIGHIFRKSSASKIEVNDEKCAPKIKLFNEFYQSNPLFHSLGLA
jgi:hypothetical protein